MAHKSQDYLIGINGGDTVGNMKEKSSAPLILHGNVSRWESYHIVMPSRDIWDPEIPVEMGVFYTVPQESHVASDIGFDMTIQKMELRKDHKHPKDFTYLEGLGVRSEIKSQKHTGVFRACAIPIPPGFLAPEDCVRFSLRRSGGTAKPEIGILYLRLQELVKDESLPDPTVGEIVKELGGTIKDVILKSKTVSQKKIEEYIEEIRERVKLNKRAQENSAIIYGIGYMDGCIKTDELVIKELLKLIGGKND